MVTDQSRSLQALLCLGQRVIDRNLIYWKAEEVEYPNTSFPQAPYLLFLPLCLQALRVSSRTLFPLYTEATLQLPTASLSALSCSQALLDPACF